MCIIFHDCHWGTAVLHFMKFHFVGGVNLPGETSQDRLKYFFNEGIEPGIPIGILCTVVFGLLLLYLFKPGLLSPNLEDNWNSLLRIYNVMTTTGFIIHFMSL